MIDRVESEGKWERGVRASQEGKERVEGRERSRVWVEKRFWWKEVVV